MPSTHLSLHYHIVFSTKGRHPWIAAEWRSRLHSIIGGILRRLSGIPEAVGGVADHVHILAGLRATHRLSDVVRQVKSESSGWVRREFRAEEFAWQDGYGAFTVSASNLGGVKRYVLKQETHHQIVPFEEEYLSFLERSGLPLDEEIFGEAPEGRFK
jgi:REP element-mobilizing transposase RayT